MAVGSEPRCHRRSAAPVLAVLVLALGGCVVPERFYDTPGGETVTCGSWEIHLVDYVDGSLVGLMAWMDSDGDRAPLADELLQVDSLVVYDEEEDVRLSIRPRQASYRWDDQSGPGRSFFEVQLADSVRGLASHKREERDSRGKVTETHTEYRLLAFDPPTPQRGALETREFKDGTHHLDDLDPITFEELRTDWDLDAPRFELLFHDYDESYYRRHDRRLQVFLRAVDRRTGDVVWAEVVEFAQTAGSRWIFNLGK